MTETSKTTVTVQRSDGEPRQMTYVREEDGRHVVSEFRHGQERFYNVQRSEIKDSMLPVQLTEKEEDQVFIADFFLHSEPEVPGY